MYFTLTTQNSKFIWTRCILVNLRSRTIQRGSLRILILTYKYVCRLGSMFNFTLQYHNHITNFPFWIEIFHFRPSMVFFISQLIRYARACSSYEWFWNRDSGRFTIDSWIWFSILGLPLIYVKWQSDPRPAWMTSRPIRLFSSFMTLISRFTFIELRFVCMEHLQWGDMPAGNAYPSRYIVPSLLGLSYAPIIETSFPEFPCLLSFFQLEFPLVFCLDFAH